jgi:hypothetical protein
MKAAAPLSVIRPLPVQAPTAFVRVRPRGLKGCGVTKAGRGRVACAGSRRITRL